MPRRQNTDMRYGIEISIAPRRYFEMIAKRYFHGQALHDLMVAYRIAKAAHRGRYRKNGLREFDHCKMAALILLDEWGVPFLWIAQAELLHDLIEDTFTFSENDLRHIFGRHVSDAVMQVTKNGGDYYEKLKGSYIGEFLLKFADNLHNMREILHTSKRFRRKQIKTFEEKISPLFPIFRKKMMKSPLWKPYRYLPDLIEGQYAYAINRIRESLHVPRR